jgi:general secretion pathway protein G
MLIVLIIIGILSGSLILAATAGTDKAEALRIVSDLQNVKSAGFLFYSDYLRWPASDTDLTSMDRYIDRSLADDPNFHILSDALTRTAFVGYSNGEKMTEAVRTKLTAMSGENRLLGSANIETAPVGFYSGEPVVWVQLR